MADMEAKTDPSETGAVRQPAGRRSPREGRDGTRAGKGAYHHGICATP